MADVLEQLLIAATRLGEACDCAVVGEVSGPLLLHELIFALLRFGKLCCYDNQAQVYHEERPHLMEQKMDNNTFVKLKSVQQQ